MNKAVNHRNMRILLILILSIFSLMFCFKATRLEKTYADTSDIPKVSVESKTVHRGQTFEIKVDLSNNVGLIAMKLILDYDSSVMKLTNIVQGEALNSLQITTTNPDTEEGYGILPFRILWDGKVQDFTNGTILILTFESNIKAPIGDYPISFTYDEQNTNTDYMQPIDLNIENGIVTFIKGEYETIYRDFDGREIDRQDYNSDDTEPEEPNPPYREEDDRYTYEFIGWKGVPTSDTKTIIYEATYRAIPKIYTVFYYIDGLEKLDGEYLPPDGKINQQKELLKAVEYPYGTYIDPPVVEERQHYEFLGWYADENFSSVSMDATMPAKNIKLYGYYKFDVRERNVPIISLEEVDIKNNGQDVVVTAKILKNSGFNAMVLTLNYDKEALIFDHFERGDILFSMQFDTTNTQNMSSENDDFKFYFEDEENNYETGEFLKLYFKLKEGIEEGTYNVWFDYDYHTDATYVTADKELKYTMLEFYNGEVPIGLKYHWNVNLSSERGVDVTSSDGKPMNWFLEVELVTGQIEIDPELIRTTVGEGMYLSSAYEIKLIQNKKEVQPDTILVIKIKLTEKEQKGNIKFYFLNDNFELISHKNFKVENGELVFITDHLSNWVIFSDYTENGGNSGTGNKPITIFGSRGNAVILMGMPLLLAIATMLYALRLRQKITQTKKEAAKAIASISYNNATGFRASVENNNNKEGGTQ